MHLDIRDKTVPVRQVAPACPGMEINARQPKGRGNQGRSRFAIRSQTFAVQHQLGVKFPWPPAHQNIFHRGQIDAKKTG